MNTLQQLMEKNFSEQERTEIRQKAKEKIAAIRLRQVRKTQHISQKKLAEAMGLSQSVRRNHAISSATSGTKNQRTGISGR